MYLCFSVALSWLCHGTRRRRATPTHALGRRPRFAGEGSVLVSMRHCALSRSHGCPGTRWNIWDFLPPSGNSDGTLTFVSSPEGARGGCCVPERITRHPCDEMAQPDRRGRRTLAPSRPTAPQFAYSLAAHPPMSAFWWPCQGDMHHCARVRSRATPAPGPHRQNRAPTLR